MVLCSKQIYHIKHRTNSIPYKIPLNKAKKSFSRNWARLGYPNLKLYNLLESNFTIPYRKHLVYSFHIGNFLGAK